MSAAGLHISSLKRKVKLWKISLQEEVTSKARAHVPQASWALIGPLDYALPKGNFTKDLGRNCRQLLSCVLVRNKEFWSLVMAVQMIPVFIWKPLASTEKSRLWEHVGGWTNGDLQEGKSEVSSVHLSPLKKRRVGFCSFTVQLTSMKLGTMDNLNKIVFVCSLFLFSWMWLAS